MSEEKTKSLVMQRLNILNDYPNNPDETVDNITIYKEDSYKGFNSFLKTSFEKASKRLTGKKGSPDYTVYCDDLLIVIECKEKTLNHQSHENLEKYKETIGSSNEICDYAVNGALHYASFLNNKCDVIAVGVSGTTKKELKITSFLYPKNKNISDIILLEDAGFENALMSISDYQKIINEKLNIKKKEKQEVFDELTRYAGACNNYLRVNGISATDRAGFISAIVLGLTNSGSQLVTLTDSVYEQLVASKNIAKDTLGENVIKNLKDSLEKILKDIDKVPEQKRIKLKEYYDKILKSALLDNPEYTNYFDFGTNILSTCVYSIYKNIIKIIDGHTDLDIMGTFYTVFLKYTKGDAKEKGIVLTPKHITEIFCDIAEHYLNAKLDENIKVLDICAGTGGFLIAALNRMFQNIEGRLVDEKTKLECKKKVITECLYGAEKEDSIFALSYANMRFHRDGKSNLFCCSSLLKDQNKKEGKIDGKADGISLQSKMNEISPLIGMINPPYSLKEDKTSKKKVKDKNEKDDDSQGKKELDFVLSMLEYLQPRGIGMAIVPLSCGSSSKTLKMRQEILKNHTLLAVMSMNKNLFQNSKVATYPCIMVFQAKVPHDYSKSVFFSRWTDDGFITIPHRGRIETDEWQLKRKEWLSMLSGDFVDSTLCLKQKISKKDEWCAEAYIETDYSQLTEDKFLNQLKKYALFNYLLEANMEIMEDKTDG